MNALLLPINGLLNRLNPEMTNCVNDTNYSLKILS